LPACSLVCPSAAAVEGSLLGAGLRLDGAALSSSSAIRPARPCLRRRPESLVEIDVGAHGGSNCITAQGAAHLGEARDLSLRLGLHKWIGEFELDFLAA